MVIFILLLAVTLGMSILFHPAWLAGSLALAMVQIIIVYGYRYGHIEDSFTVEKLKKQREIYKKMADDLIPKFTVLLKETFPSIEKDIFSGISAKEVDIFITKYPEIKSDKTIMELVSLINSKTSKMYDCDLRTESVIARINTRKADAKAWIPINLSNFN